MSSGSVLASKNARIKKTAGDKVFDTFNMIFWIIVLGLVMYPLYLVIMASVSSPEAVINGDVIIWPVDFSMMGYEAVFGYAELWNSYMNSLIYTVAGTLIAVGITLMAAYATSRDFIGKGLVNFIVIFTMFFSGGLIPTFLVMRDIGLYNTRLMLIISGACSVWNLMVARTYIRTTVPNELYEAAVMDGASHFVYLIKVVLPLCGTIAGVLSVYYGVGHWNDYFTALVYIRDRVKLPLQTILREILASLQATTALDSMFDTYAADNLQGIVETQRKAQVAKYCCIVISTGPAVVLYVFMQKFFVKGVMIGSLKG